MTKFANFVKFYCNRCTGGEGAELSCGGLKVEVGANNWSGGAQTPRLLTLTTATKHSRVVTLKKTHLTVNPFTATANEWKMCAVSVKGLSSRCVIVLMIEVIGRRDGRCSAAQSSTFHIDLVELTLRSEYNLLQRKLPRFYRATQLW